ncbi:hypothetical protein BDN71DRAFT_1432456 [Pleurotus eryngii]|uniref:Uncharacterized protein n=1 Tax=Pleurotus eryngii TaxID=5323 RepID=A0A9P5ZTK3_PLEER|nr:hypothetical protein BDN71DRAFT_1432456 [Pleurotus eryngii]
MPQEQPNEAKDNTLALYSVFWHGGNKDCVMKSIVMRQVLQSNTVAYKTHHLLDVPRATKSLPIIVGHTSLKIFMVKENETWKLLFGIKAMEGSTLMMMIYWLALNYLRHKGMAESAGGSRDTDESGRPTVNILMNNAIGKAMRNGKDILVRNSFSLDSDTIDNRWVVKTICTIAAHIKSPKVVNEGLKTLADVVEAMTKQRLVDNITEMVMKDV